MFGALLFAGTLLGPASPASALDLLPNPQANIGFCKSGGAARILLHNIGGLAAAQFLITYDYNGPGSELIVVAPDTVEERLFWVPEGGSITLTASESQTGYTASDSMSNMDCFQATGTISGTCVNGQYVLDIDAHVLAYAETLSWELNGVEQNDYPSALVDSAVIPQGSNFTATIVSQHDGVITQFSDVADCAPPTTLPPTTLPPTTLPATTVALPGEAPTPASTLPAPTAAAAASPPHGGLPVTGSRETRTSFIAATLLLAGIVLVVTARRPIRD